MARHVSTFVHPIAGRGGGVPLPDKVGTWRATSGKTPTLYYGRNNQTWHATSLHLSTLYRTRWGRPITGL
ncbi:MAG: hypothetical protein HDS16_08125 [Bacteroides sp.]|nr:hypothetical protein [Bacteroides sp.]